ncbi:MAG: hypothetical protein Q9N34_01260 [Aquificota bacterium]|nr:hypothetical protein [Aquificota bacterium]
MVETGTLTTFSTPERSSLTTISADRGSAYGYLGYELVYELVGVQGAREGLKLFLSFFFVLPLDDNFMSRVCEGDDEVVGLGKDGVGYYRLFNNTQPLPRVLSGL